MFFGEGIVPASVRGEGAAWCASNPRNGTLGGLPSPSRDPVVVKAGEAGDAVSAAAAKVERENRFARWSEGKGFGVDWVAPLATPRIRIGSG